MFFYSDNKNSQMDKREFQKSLEAYYREKGKHPPPQTPVLAGKPISLHLLFERVTKLGGSYILSNEDRWQDILQGIYTATTRVVVVINLLII